MTDEHARATPAQPPVPPVQRAAPEPVDARLVAAETRQVAPAWLAKALILGGVVLVPWTLYLAVVLPTQYTGRHYRGTWIGFDLALLTALIVTGAAAVRGARRLDLAAAATGTLLFVDAWFDIMGSGTPDDFRVALLMAVAVEIPIGIVCWVLAFRADTGDRPSVTGVDG